MLLDHVISETEDLWIKKASIYKDSRAHARNRNKHPLTQLNSNDTKLMGKTIVSIVFGDIMVDDPFF
jgi:hypothetical protein